MTGKYWNRTAIILWIILIVVVCVKTILKPLSGNIYITFAHAGADFVEGQPLYNMPYEHTDNYRYSPLTAACFAPFGMLPWGVGGALWRLLSAIVFLSGLLALARRVGPSLPWAGFLILSLPLCFHSFHNGQTNPMVTGWMLWATAWAYDRHWTRAGMILGCAILMKIFPIALAGLFILVAPVRASLPIIGTVVIGLALPFALQSTEYVTEQYRCWFNNLQNDDRTQFPLYAGYQDVHMLLRVAGIQIPKAQYLYIQAITGILSALVILVQLLRKTDTRDVIMNAFNLGICWMILFGASVETSTFTLLAPVFARELLDRRNQPSWAFWLACAGAVCFTVALIALTMPHAVHRPIIATGVQPLGALLVCISAISRVLQTPRSLPVSDQFDSGIHTIST